MNHLATQPDESGWALEPPLPVTLVSPPAEPCPYLPGRLSRVRAFYASRLPPELYHQFMDAGFRRSGKVIYQPACRGCRACVPIRAIVDRFTPSKSQRRCWRRNQDLQVSVGPPVFTEEKYRLYRRYLHDWHQRTGDDDPQSFRSFLYDSPVDSLEFTYRDRAGRLVAAGICDVCCQSLSSVYFWYGPEESRRGLGTFGVLQEIQFARQRGIAYYYLGYWVTGCSSMAYKRSFRPNELLGPDGGWREAVPP